MRQIKVFAAPSFQLRILIHKARSPKLIVLNLRDFEKIFRFGLLIKADKIVEDGTGKQHQEIFMAEKKNRLPFLFIVSFLILLIGTVGLLYIFLIHPPSDIFKGLLYISFGFIAFGTGEILNHPKAQLITTGKDDDTSPTFSKHLYRKRNPCSLGNLFDIGALLLFFIGLSALLFRQ